MFQNDLRNASLSFVTYSSAPVSLEIGNNCRFRRLSKPFSKNKFSAALWKLSLLHIEQTTYVVHRTT